MKENLIAAETIKLAMEKNFIETTAEDGDEVVFTVPTQALLQKWLREKHKIIVTVFYDENINGDWHFKILFGYSVNEDEDEYYEYEELFILRSENNFETYEYALEMGLQTALELIK